MKKEVNQKRAKVLSIIASITLVLFITGASVAYFLNEQGEGAIQNTRITTASTDSLVFKFDEAIQLTATTANFGKTSGSITKSTAGTAILKSNAATSATYNVYLNIEANDFVYTQEDETPELLLKITKPDGTVLSTTTTIDKLSNVVDNKGVTQTGFDITTYTGYVLVAEDYAIASTSDNLTVEQEWQFEVTYVNLNAVQMENGGKTLSAKVIMTTTKYDYPSMTSSLTSNETLNSFRITTTFGNGAAEATKYYFSIDDGATYASTTNNYYDFTGLEQSTTYSIKVYTEDSNNMISDVYTTTGTTYPILLTDKVKSQYTSNTASIEAGYGVFYHNGTITGTSAGIDDTTDILDAEDLSYRFAGASCDYTAINTTYSSSYTNVNKTSASDKAGLIGMYCGSTERYPAYSCSNNKYYYIVPVGKGTQYSTYEEAYAALLNLGVVENIDNYVCFGSDADECPVDNLYRIIGAFTFDNGNTYHIKLIKNSVISLGTWDSSGSNTWMRPASIRTNLNGKYLTGLGSIWSNKIYQAIWKVGGDDYTKIYYNVSVKTSYTNEMASLGGTNKPTTGTTDASGAYIDNESKIGLMYVSDYGYASSPKYWKTVLGSGNLPDFRNVAWKEDWLYSETVDYLITRNGTDSREHVYIAEPGVANSLSVTSGGYSRPTFYLTSDSMIVLGSGKFFDPYRLLLS